MLSRLANLTVQVFQDKKNQLFTEWDRMNKIFEKELETKKCEEAMKTLAKKGYCPRDWINLKELEDAKVQKAECEICLDTLTSRAIYSCQKCYNLICVKCYRAVENCPYCRTHGPHFAQRNFAVERFISTLLLPCKYHRYGCMDLLNRDNRAKHEKHCKYEPIYCPFFYNCGYHGNFSEIESHLNKLHSTSLTLRNHHVWGLTGLRAMLKSSASVKIKQRIMLSCFESLFTVKISFLNNRVYFTFKQVRNTLEKLNGKQFGMFIELRSQVQIIKGMVQLSKENNKQKLELLPHVIVPKTGNDNLQVILNVRHIDHLLK